jgi:hypothetical protein
VYSTTDKYCLQVLFSFFRFTAVPTGRESADEDRGGGGDMSTGVTVTSRYSTEPVFVNLLRSPRIDSQTGGPVLKPYLSYRPAKLQAGEIDSSESTPGLLKRLQIRTLYKDPIPFPSDA